MFIKAALIKPVNIIVQITDTHIVPFGKKWKGDGRAKTDIRLELIIDHINSLPTLPDLIIHTGDIVDNGSKESYQNAKRILDNLRVQYFLTCGNHDNYNNLKYVFRDHDYFLDSQFSHYVINCGNLRIIVLDTQVPGEEFGFLCDYRINWLENELKGSSKPTAIFMHHFPIDVNNVLFRGINLIDSNKFAELVLNYSNIIGVYCGHYHYFVKEPFAKTTCWVSPSTAPSHILTNGDKVKLNHTEPSYSIHDFYGKKQFISKVIKLQNVI